MCIGRYLGDSSGNISVLKLEQEPCHMVQMKYTIPSTASHGEIDSYPIMSHCYAICCDKCCMSSFTPSFTLTPTGELLEIRISYMLASSYFFIFFLEAVNHG